MINKSLYNDNSRVFVFTNENTCDYIGNFGEFKDKNVLSVASSGDQAFEAILAGAKHVDTFDVNIMQKYIMGLKTKIIRNLDYGKFMDFFFSEHNRFNISLLSSIDKLFTNDDIVILTELMGRKHYKYATPETIKNISYLSSTDKYKDLQVRLPEKFNFKHMDIHQLSRTINKEYDIMMLSNIFETMFSEQKDLTRAMQMYYESILKPLSEKLNKSNGIIFMDYMWSVPYVSEIAYFNYYKHFLQHWSSYTPSHHPFEIRAIKSNTPTIPLEIVMYMRQISR
jgi:hypothetical protein